MTATKETSVSATHHEWDLIDRIPSKSIVMDYGYVINGQVVGATRQGLFKVMVQRAPEISFVWTPDTPEPVFPETVPFLVGAFRRAIVREARNAVLWGGAFVALALLLAVGLQEADFFYRSIFFVFGALGLTEGIWQYVRSRYYTQDDAKSDASTARFTSWLKKSAQSGYTFTLAAFIAVVGAAQFLASEPVEAAGLVKPDVWNGQIWRLLTATLMHVNFMHFWMNCLVLLHFAKIIERTLHPAFVPLVFLITAAIGSLFSVFLYPNSTSVGASGGLMGLLGFITVAAYFDRNKYPPKYFRQMVEAIILVAMLGLFGFAFIDNAAHFGGLAGGLLLGWFFLRIRKEQWTKKKEKPLQLGGLACLTLLGFTAALAVSRMLTWL